METARFSSVFSQIFDVVIVGTGHAGLAAALTLGRAGRKVLLVGAAGDLAWESGRALTADAGKNDCALWRELENEVGKRGGRAEHDGRIWLDGAITEVIATDLMTRASVRTLYWAPIVAVERAGESVAAMIVATKAGPRRVLGRQWIDATETGELMRMVDATLSARAPSSRLIHLYLQHADWASLGPVAWLQPTAWPTERVMSFSVAVDDSHWRQRTLEGLARLEETLGDRVSQVSMSHFSFQPLPIYDRVPGTAAGSRWNIASAAPGLRVEAIATPADRFALGIRAAETLGELGVHEVSPNLLTAPLPVIKATSTIKTTVCVAGAGTGGALAALAAREAGADVVCIEPQPFAGGIGVGGGIHFYYYGVAGGLQQNLDRRTRDLMAKFHGGPLADGPFNPWAKMIVLEQMLEESGASVLFNSLLLSVEHADGKVTAVLAATPRGVVRIEADSFVDGTGDGDLAAMAGAPFTLGREHDGLTHAYTQSSGALRDLNGRPRMRVVNFDSGYCDPTDPEDLTRARVVGIHHYLRADYSSLERPTYIAPALGLRQARQVVTEYILSLDDQLSGRVFEDPIGYTGSHYDNHATDYEFESDEAVFWVWVNRHWWGRYASQMPYRILVPRGLRNVWIASRCAGVSQDAHHATRMQRDIQRIGEAAGFAAAEASRRTVDAIELPYASLKAWLDRTGALAKSGVFNVAEFGAVMEGDLVKEGDNSTLAMALESLDRGEPGQRVWWLYSHREAAEASVVQRLADGNPTVSWLAACIMAMWRMPAAEARLVLAITDREYGFPPEPTGVGADGKPVKAEPSPLNTSRLVPNWLVAAALLRRIGTEACVKPLLDLLVSHSPIAVNTGTTIALTLEQLALRGALSGRCVAEVRAMLDRMPSFGVVGTIESPARPVGQAVTRAARGEVADIRTTLPAFGQSRSDNVLENNRWQFDYAIGRARAAVGMPLHAEALRLASDPRSLVRRAFMQLSAIRSADQLTPSKHA